MILSFVGPASWLYANTVKMYPSLHKSQRSPFEKESIVYKYRTSITRTRNYLEFLEFMWNLPRLLELLFVSLLSSSHSTGRKKSTQQYWKVLGVVLSSLFFNEEAMYSTFVWSTKGEVRKVFLTATVSGTVYWSYPISPFGIVACTLSFRPFSK